MRKMAVFAYEHSPFYHQFYNEHKVNPETVKIPEGLPTVSQIDLVTSALQFRTDIHAFKVCASSGTTGKPKLMFRTEQDFAKSVANQIRLMEWSKVVAGDVVAIVQPFGLWGYGELTQEAARKMGAMALPIGMVSDEVALELIRSVGATVLDISPSRLRNLLRIVQQKAIGDIKIHSVMLAGESIPVILQEQVKKLWGANVFNQYGSEETDALGGSRDNINRFCLFDTDFVFEFLADENASIEVGQVGRLVITSLYHEGTPLIRYEMQDLAKLHENGEIEILGRVGEYVLLYDSVKLYPYHIDYALRKVTDQISGWQCVIEDAAHRVRVTLKMQTPDQTIEPERILWALSKCNIDVEALVDKGDLEFIVDSTAPFVTTQRGKTPGFVDLRELVE